MVDNINDIWENQDWTHEARQLVASPSEFPDDAKLILILRHSHRTSTRDVREMINVGLTPIGRGIARKFGKSLTKDRTIRLSYSLSPRCKETASEILAGFQESNGTGTLMGPLKPLYYVGGTGEFITSQMFKHRRYKFIIRWAAGLYPEDQIQPFNEYCRQVASIIWNQVEKLEAGGIDIHVTHDLHLVALRMGWFGIPPEMNWPSFLSGFIFSIDGNHINLYHSGKLKEMKVPFWW